jgi:hypothetical protein
VALDEPGGNRVCGGDRDLLADDRPDSGLERIPGPGWTEARSYSQQRTDGGVVGELDGGLVEIEVEVRDAARALHDVHELFPMWQVRAEHEVVVFAGEEFEHAGVAPDDDGAPVGARRDLFDAWYRARGEVGGRRVPVEHPPVGQPQRQPAIGDQTIGFAAARTQRPRWGAEDLPAAPVELAQAAEARRERDLRRLGAPSAPAVYRAPGGDAGRAGALAGMVSFT